MTPNARLAGERAQHASGDRVHAEDAPAPDEPPVLTDAPELDESLPAGPAGESREKWWDADADHERPDTPGAAAARLS